jgi:hypothetical protein
VACSSSSSNKVRLNGARMTSPHRVKFYW